MPYTSDRKKLTITYRTEEWEKNENTFKNIEEFNKALENVGNGDAKDIKNNK